MSMQPHKLDTREKIILTFKELVMEKSIDKIKIKDITDRIGMTRPTFYTYFQDKYEVVEYIFTQEVIEPVIPFIKNGFIREGVLCILMQMDKDKDFYREASRGSGQNSFQEMLHRTSFDLLLDMVSEKVKLKKKGILSVTLVAEYYENIFQFVIRKWLNEKEEIPPAEMMQIYDFLVSRSINDLMEGNV
ncbi:MAG: TetR/AcrR family transcriptional regulator C-terminal domain-containing protein [Blautia sp.]|jgi:AcrR family transcriptional regulator